MSQDTVGDLNSKNNTDRKHDAEKEKKFELSAPPSRVDHKQRKKKGPETTARFPIVTPLSKCKLCLLKLEQIKNYLLMEDKSVANQKRLKPREDRNVEDRSKVVDLRGTPMSVGNLEELIHENHAIVYPLLGLSITLVIVGLLQDEVDTMMSVMKIEKALLQSYADIGGLDA